MKVRATALCYYGNKRRYPADSNHPEAGEVFVLEDVTVKDKEGKPLVVSAEKQFNPKCMEKVEGHAPIQMTQSVPKKSEHAVKEAPKGRKSTGDRDVI